MITNDMESRKKMDNSIKLKGGVVMGKLFFVFALCLVFTTFAGAYDVINIDINGSGSDPVYNDANGPVTEDYKGMAVIDQWNGYFDVEGDLMMSPRCVDIDVPPASGTYGRSVFVADDPINAHGYVPYTTGGELLGDGFISTGTDPCLYLYGNWAHGGIFDVYILSNVAGSFSIRDGKGTIQSGTVSGGGTENSWSENVNYVKFEDVWILGTDTRDANGLVADYLDNDEYVTDSNVAVITYSNVISGIQLVSIKKRIMAAGPSDPCICYWDNDSETKKKITSGQWSVDTPTAVINSPLASGRRLLLAADYDAAYETNARGDEHDYDGPDSLWAWVPGGSNEPVLGYVDETWSDDGYLNYVDTGEWMQYDIITTRTPTDTTGEYKVRALLNCWWAAAELGVYTDASKELGKLTHPKYEDMVPPIDDPNALVWSENYVTFNFFSGLRTFKWKQNGSYYNVMGFEIGYIQPIQINNCGDVFKYSLEIEGDVDEDCYVNMNDLKVIVDDWANCNNPEDNDCIVEEP